MKRTKSTYLALVAILLSTTAANADPILFELTDGTDLLTWVLDSNPVPDVATDPNNFQIHNIAASLNGGDFLIAVTRFFTSDRDGGLNMSDSSDPFISPIYSARGPQVFTGPTVTPEFVLGVYSLTLDSSGCSFCQENEPDWLLTLSAVAAVPEPGTLALLGLGLFGMGLARRNKKV